jgi:glycosyltransferase involved in cell wall biosynthesis
MRIGSIVLSTNQGLGVLAKSFYDSGLIQEVLIKEHGTLKNHPEWFDNAPFIGNPADAFIQTLHPSVDERIVITNFLSKIDVLLVFEIPFYFSLHSGDGKIFGYDILKDAKRMGVKTVLMPMYECTPYPMEADLYLCPSKLDYEVYKKMYPEANIRQVTIPVDVSWKQRTQANTFVYNAGNGGTNDRNGTSEVIESLQHIESPIQMIIRSQKPLDISVNDDRVDVRIGTVEYEELFSEGDVFLFPEKFNGLSLPLQEAYASGMLVMTTDRFPNTQWLPNEPLIPVSGYVEDRIVNVPFHRATIDPVSIAKTIDLWYKKDITKYSNQGKMWGEEHSWKNMLPKYLKVIKEGLSK